MTPPKKQPGRRAKTSVDLEPTLSDCLEEALFELGDDLILVPMNAAADTLCGDLPKPQCYRVFRGQSAPCTNCRLDELTMGASVPCPPAAGAESNLCAQVLQGQDGSVVAIASRTSMNQACQLLTDGRVCMLEHTGSGIVLANVDGTIVYANSYAESSLGLGLCGKSLPVVLPGIDLVPNPQQRQIRFAGDAATGERVIGYRCTDAMVSGAKGTLVTFRDVTEVERMRSEVERMERLSEAGRMMSVLAHEMRNPLAGIKATAQSMEFEADESLAYGLKTITREVDRLEALLKEYLTFGRHQMPRPHNVSIEEVLRSAVASAKHRFAELKLDVSCRGVGQVWLDAHQVQQALLNLLINAADATPAGGLVWLRAYSRDKAIYLEVEDTGSGMDQQQQKHACDAFYTTKGHGTGLGLAVCFRVAKDHGGTLTIDSEVGRGTKMTICLPNAQPRTGGFS